MYVLYKAAEVFLAPGFWIALGMAAALFFSREKSHPALGRFVLALTLAAFIGLSTRPLSDAIARPLERDFPAVDPATIPKQEAIVVLGGGAHLEPGTGKASLFDTPTLDRLVEGVVLWRANVAPWIVVSGGVGDALHASPAEAPAMRDLAIALGVPAEAIAVEDSSRTTAENAARVREKFPPLKKIALVSSASHLSRAERLFQKQGFEVTPVAAGHVVTPDGWSFDSFVPGGTSLRRSETALHEEAGLLLGR